MNSGGPKVTLPTKSRNYKSERTLRAYTAHARGWANMSQSVAVLSVEMLTYTEGCDAANGAIQ